MSGEAKRKHADGEFKNLTELLLLITRNTLICLNSHELIIFKFEYKMKQSLLLLVFNSLPPTTAVRKKFTGTSKSQDYLVIKFTKLYRKKRQSKYVITVGVLKLSWRYSLL